MNTEINVTDITKKEYEKIKASQHISRLGSQVFASLDDVLKQSRTLTGHKFRNANNQKFYSIDGKAFFCLSNTEMSKAGLIQQGTTLQGLKGF